MLILTIRTDKPEAEIGLFEDDKKLAYVTWQAHRHLSETIHSKINDLLETEQKDWSKLRAIVAFQGPGSFTGLRIGLTVANALAASLNIPIVASQSDDWVKLGIKALINSQNNRQVLPEYGSVAHITKQKK